ncbi:zinc finger MYM-type protein 1 [Brachypodium distachyon]|uniref:zinc finger MYM-type protein 1 n=1 Tax=Brachypodium distachyon TaxID=15368 RepID=UPI00052FF4D1|nr:zinc finger MYM-type protein 1 [Brachypodium distachyon]|eukprot:XP_024310349.1 zinc finger MYM-type protein 1 [Brachypodium distachyon]
MPQIVDLDKLTRDPIKRKRITDYHPNQHEEIRRKYLTWGPYQPRAPKFKARMIGKSKRYFNPDWYDLHGNWLEYNEVHDKAYCLCCYLFRDNIKGNKAGHDAFVIEGFVNWKKGLERFVVHLGDRDSFHNKALKNCDDLMKKAQSIPAALHKQSEMEKNEHLIRVNAAIDVYRHLLHQGQPFRGHYESKESINKGNYQELMDYTIAHNDVIAKAFKNAPANNQMLSPMIQRYITECFAEEILGCILKEIDNGAFSLLVDECRDVSDKEQMGVVLRYVGKCGAPYERFVGVAHVEETTTAYLKSTIDFMMAKLGLSLQQVRGQGYDGASNMSVVAIAKKIIDVGDFFDMISLLVTVVGSSCKRKDILRENHREERKDMDIANAISDVESIKRELEKLRSEHGWSSLMKKLVLTLPIATASVERCFSAMKFVKNALRNKMGDEYLSHSLICFVEKELLDNIPNELIVKRFHGMKERRGMKRKVAG